MTISVKLTPLKRVHLKKTLKWMNDPRIVAPFGRASGLRWKDHTRWFESLSKDKSQIIYAIVSRSGSVHCGNIGLKYIDHRHRSAEVWVYIGETEMQGRGLGSAALRELLKISFRKLRLHRLQAKVFTDNQSSLALFKKCGFKKEGKLKECFWLKGKYRDMMMMSIINSRP